MKRKKKVKRIIALVCIVALVALLVAMPLLAKEEAVTDGPQASILSGNVSIGSIQKELIGGGTLTEEDAILLSVPSAVKLEKFLVSNGDAVTQGTAIATVDRVTVMTAITQVQETLEYLSEQIESNSETDAEESISALAGGIVKIIYAEEGFSAQSVMLQHGALAVLSLDGLMAVDLQTESTLSAGTAVTLTFSDGTQSKGKIEKNLAGSMTVTVEDQNYAVGDTVRVEAEDGSLIGEGELYIYSPWNATAYAGTVESIEVSVGDELDAGDTLMILSDVGYSATYQQLVGQRREYEELMLELFEMYQTQTVTAPCDGVVYGIDQNSAQLLSGGSGGYTLRLLANAPNGDDETLYSNYVGKVTALADNGWVLSLNPEPVLIDDYLELSGINTDAALMTQTVLYTKNEAPVFALTDGAWQQVEYASVGEGDILLFATGSDGCPVWCVLLEKAQPEEPDVPTEPDTPTEPDKPSEPDVPTNPDTPTDPGQSDIPNNPSSPGGSSAQPGFSYPSGNGFGSMGDMSGIGGMDGMTEQEPEFELYGLQMAQIATVTPQLTMALEITVDELDVTALQVGMSAQVKIDALGGEKYTATVAQIGNTGTNNGGNNKYTVKLTMERAENMLSGMTATATIVLSTVNEVLTIPADALSELGNQTVVYTAYDEENDSLTNPVTVQVGVSDGETVQIVDGLTDGQTYYYAYYDTPVASVTPDFGTSGGFMFGGQ